MKQPEEHKNSQITISLMAADLQYRMEAQYHEALKQQVFLEENCSAESDLQDRFSARNKLSTIVGRQILTYVWRRSKYIPPNVLIAAGYPNQPHDEAITSHALATEFCEVGGVSDLNTLTRIQRDTSRVVAAASVYSLILFQPSPANKKPFLGTELLHELMMATHFPNAMLIQSLIDDLGNRGSGTGNAE
ncbi:hypothetical protein [Sulfitobacter donghicola]|uniref:Uncharacterized protein n=1 Tax=Sulfitobacter donghicola DSW-25 = KCTC 12864 = JCM 14565 TaxID=1300350 RepID=A0A073IFL2_9RHOB|nr:hypothetical protein [Sulfitobacter donghicola]KEJ89138.1 hypothetical protein DSW25_11640 [Sulfitobacter donghicola DSW-25 = KCTC 12864 = JCM 14565]KIN67565.1 hypothetical protein Z948_1280 [Sulfitobacter donghicola DSW-25 = KCTC 12864 = JCM 14565]